MFSLFSIFSTYVDPFERKVDKFFRNIKSTDSFAKVKGKLLALMQGNLMILNVWLEKKFKGYKYLNKKTRRRMYADVKKIVATFEEFRKTHVFSVNFLQEKLDALGLSVPRGKEEELQYLAQIMAFLQPGKYYHYIQTASFGKLLCDPAVAKMEGDCNQIVTLYIYLFSLHYPLDQLEIKLLPEHVCLHFQGIDIEATNGQFYKYSDYEHLLPVTEIISTNLLDMADFREKVQDISPRDMVKSSQLAYAISSLKSVVTDNLEVAYHNLTIAMMEANDFESALYYASKLRNPQLLRAVKHNKGVYLLKNGKYDSALTVFKDLGEMELVKACYGKKYNDLAKLVDGVKTLEQAKKHKATYQKMQDLARKMGENSLERGVREILDKI